MGLDVLQFKNLELEIKQQKSLLLRKFNFRELSSSSDFWENYFERLKRKLDEAKEMLKTENIRIQALDGNTPEAKVDSDIWRKQYKIYTACMISFQLMDTIFNAGKVNEDIFNKGSRNKFMNTQNYLQQELIKNTIDLNKINKWSVLLEDLMQSSKTANDNLEKNKQRIEHFTLIAQTEEDQTAINEYREICDKTAASNSTSMAALETMRLWVRDKKNAIILFQNHKTRQKRKPGRGFKR